MDIYKELRNNLIKSDSDFTDGYINDSIIENLIEIKKININELENILINNSDLIY